MIHRLALFDLDNTLLTGDTDVLWCDFLIQEGRLDGEKFAAANADMERRYQAGNATADEFSAFYVSLLKGIHYAEGLALRQRFFATSIKARICDDARALVERHRAAGEVLVMTTATNRFITELTAADFKIEHLIATETELIDGIFTERTVGVLNMRDGKVTRLAAWLAARGWDQALMAAASFYSDSINDLPLLSRVAHPVAVDADAKLAEVANARGWAAMKFRRGSAA